MELVSQGLDTLRSLDWYAILFVGGMVLAALSAFQLLSGLEGWVLASSLNPWVRGFLSGAVVVAAAGAAILFWAMKTPPDNQPAWAGLGIAAGLGGLLVARITVAAFWKLRWLRIFFWGGLLGAAAYVAGALLKLQGGGAAGNFVQLAVEMVVLKDQAGRVTANWPGMMKLAIAFAAGGGVYSLVYRLFYPFVWLLRNAVLLAAGVILLSRPVIRQGLANLLKGRAGGEQLRDAAAGDITVVAALAGGALLLVAYAMWIQNFSRRFRNLSRRVLEAKYGSFSLAAMIGCSVETALSTLGRMFVLKRMDTEESRLFMSDQDEEGEDDEGEKGEGKKGKKKSAKSKRRDKD